MSSRSRAVVALLTVLLATSACGRFARSGSPPPSLPPPVEYGKDLTFTPPPKPGEGFGTLTIGVIEEETNRPIAGAIVEYAGASKGRMVTDEQGRASKRLKTGLYTLSLPPCGRDVMITTAAEVDASVELDTESGGFMSTTWEPRYRPSPSVIASPQPPWDQGETVDLGVRLQDGCDFSEAPGKTASHFAWTSDGPFGFTQQPGLRAGNDGSIHVRFRCTGTGDGSITIFNRFDQSMKVDLLRALSAPADGGPFCR